VARGDAAPYLDVQKSILDLVALAVDVLVKVAWLLTILAWQDVRLHTLVPCSSDNGIAVVAFYPQSGVRH
jgi:hypothetical protein